MKIVLKRKQNSSNADWLRVFRNIEKYVSRTEVEAAADKTMSEMSRTLSEYRRPIYAYSGGKDSIVLADLCRNVGVNVGVMAVTGMEYPAFERWLAKNLPQGVRTVSTGQTLEWLKMHPERFIFQPAAGTDKQIPINIGVQHKFYDAYGADVILLGRRKADGNHIGFGRNIYTDGAGRTKYNPLSDWPHELILGYIHYKRLEMPPFYAWPDGFIQGTHPWFYRQVQKGSTFERTVQEIIDIDSMLLAEAAKTVPVIREVLENL